LFEECSDFGRDFAFRRERRLEFVEFRLIGQLAVPQQVDGFFKCGVFSQSVDVVPLVAE